MDRKLKEGDIVQQGPTQPPLVKLIFPQKQGRGCQLGWPTSHSDNVGKLTKVTPVFKAESKCMLCANCGCSKSIMIIILFNNNNISLSTP